ncbi:MAG: TonB-dependent receptor plug domain-containing protein [Microscillaceae bacterium]|nr:TonB-dependent receptor plug domain-containing protein [Microscillaceae bacterium]MDW8461755.1 TonB-dependent receptor plug domain-containing protein [Cytophagales bacterium]
MRLYFAPNVEEVLQAKKAQKEEASSVASFKELALREIPSIVTIISKEEILQSGARDLLEILRFVPGIDFGQNFDFVGGIAIRGNWAEEGKILLLIDGQVLNDASFGTVIFTQRLLLADIERIEIIRGAGSAMYGGLAALSVINIITQKNVASHNVQVQWNIGASENALSRNNLQVSLRQKTGYSQHSLSIALNQANLSNALVDLPNTSRFSLRDSSQTQMRYFNYGLKHKQLQLRAIFTEYAFTSTPRILKGTMRDYLIGLSYEWNINEKLKILPRLQWKQQQPWWYQNYQNLPNRKMYEQYQLENQRLNQAITLLYQSSPKLNFATGYEYFWDYARYDLQGYQFYNQKSTISFHNIALFTELTWQNKIATLTAGARYDKNSAFQAAFAPRLALTKVWRQWHGKAIANYAFKAPTIQNIQYARKANVTIRPEWVSTFEVELGYKFSEKLSWVANAYQIQIDGPILYIYNPATFEEYYTNQDRAGTRGIESELKWVSKKGFLKVNYSFYQNHRTTATTYLLNLDSKNYLLLGLPAHKFTLLANYKVNKTIWLNTSLLGLSEKYTFVYKDFDFQDFALQRYPSTWQWNVSCLFKNVAKNLDISLLIYNLLNQTQWLISPVNSGINPFVEPRREFVLRLHYQIGN